MSEQPSNTPSQRLFRQVYETLLQEGQPVEVPVDAIFLSAQVDAHQRINLYWEIAYQIAPSEVLPQWGERTIKGFPTNRGVPPDAVYLATVSSFGTVWHLYERRPATQAPTTNKVEGPSKTK